MSEFDKQEDIRISVENVKTTIRKMTNWKAPGPDFVQGYWFKRFSTLHSRLIEDLQTCIVEGDVPTWMTKRRITFIQKDPEKGNAANNYSPIACLPLMWKLLTSILAEKIYAHLSEKNVPPDEQKGCRKDSRGTKYQLLIDKQVLKHCKNHQHNLAVGWIDYKKAYYMVSHRWLIEAMKMVEIADNIANLFENSKETWRTELIAYNESLGEVDIKRGIFQGDSFSPLLFVVVLIPLSIILSETDLGYVTSRNQKLNHLFFMDNLKLYANSE